MNLLVAFPLLLAAAQDTSVSPGQALPPPPSDISIPLAPPAGDEIIVTGKPLDDPDSALANCIRKGCPPDKDVAATLAVAQNQFLKGGYADARRTINAGLDRVRKAAKDYPEPVSSLYRARSRVNGHLGEYTMYLTSQIAALDVLRDALPADDPRVIGAQIELGDTQLHLGKIRFAQDHYKNAIERARGSGQRVIEALARLRLARAIALRRGGQIGRAEQKDIAEVLAPLVGSDDPYFKGYDFAARLFNAKIAERRGAKGAIDAVFATLPAGAANAPILLSSPQIKLAGGYDRYECTETTALCAQNAYNMAVTPKFEDQWVDIGFWVTPEGNVRDTEVIRRSEGYSGDWSDGVIRSIAGRRYSRSSTDGPGFYRIERFTLTSKFVKVTGQNIQMRSPEPIIERLDLTPDPKG